MLKKQGYTKSERIVGESLTRIFGKTKGRIIIATFASNIHRIQQIIDALQLYMEEKLLFQEEVWKISLM